MASQIISVIIGIFFSRIVGIANSSSSPAAVLAHDRLYKLYGLRCVVLPSVLDGHPSGRLQSRRDLSGCCS